METQCLPPDGEATHVSSIPGWRNSSLALSTPGALGVGGDTVFCKPDPGSTADVYFFLLYLGGRQQAFVRTGEPGSGADAWGSDVVLSVCTEDLR